MCKRRTVIFSDRLDKVSQILRQTQNQVHWMILTNNDATDEIATFLRSQNNTLEIDSAKLFRKKRTEFQRNYIEFVASLNQINASLDWWAFPPTTKDPKYTRLCWGSAAFLLITEVMAQDCELLIVLTDSVNLKLQVDQWAKLQGIRSKGFIKSRRRIRTFLKLYTPAPVIKALIVCVYRWIQAKRFSFDHTSRLVIVSQTYPESFLNDDENGYRDVYFGPLYDYLKQSGIQAMIFGIVRGSFRIQNMRLKTLNYGIPIVPFEGFLTISDIIWSAAKAFWITVVGIKMCGSFQIEGKDITKLLQLEFKSEYKSGYLFISFVFFRACVRLARSVNINRCIYPFENRSWERMLILALRSESPPTRLIGYQHAAINAGLLHFFMGKGEAEVTPLPDVLLTTGEFLKEWLCRDGGYNKGMVQASCALRKKSNPNITGVIPEPRDNGKLLIALGFPDLENYNRVLTIVKDAVDLVKNWDIVVRPHPTNPASTIEAKKAIAATGINILDVRSGDLAEELNHTTAVIYVASTVALEAASAGIPTICLDIGEALETDPMRGWDKFKWQVHDVNSLHEALISIRSLSQEQFLALGEDAKEFGRAYLTPVTNSGLQMFVEI